MDGQTFFTAVIAITTVVYTIGTLWLWKTTKNALRLNILVALRQQGIVSSPSQFARMLRDTFPEAREFLGKITGEAVKEALKEN